MTPPFDPFEIPAGKDPQEPADNSDEHDPENYNALLDTDLDNMFLDCGCELTRSHHDNTVYLIWCPLHGTAEALRQSLGQLLCVLNRDKDGDYFICREGQPKVRAAREAFLKARGEA